VLAALPLSWLAATGLNQALETGERAWSGCKRQAPTLGIRFFPLSPIAKRNQTDSRILFCLEQQRVSESNQRASDSSVNCFRAAPQRRNSKTSPVKECVTPTKASNRFIACGLIGRDCDPGCRKLGRKIQSLLPMSVLQCFHGL